MPYYGINISVIVFIIAVFTLYSMPVHAEIGTLHLSQGYSTDLIIDEPYKYIVKVQDEQGNPLPVQETTPLHLYSPSQTSLFYSATLTGNCGALLPLTITDKVHARITLSKGTSQKAFCYANQSEGTHDIYFSRLEGNEMSPGEFLFTVSVQETSSEGESSEPAAATSTATTMLQVVAGTSTASTSSEMYGENKQGSNNASTNERTSSNSSYVRTKKTDLKVLNELVLLLRKIVEEITVH